MKLDHENVTDYCIDTDRDQYWYQKLLQSIGDSRFVLMGEATHGTAEFYSTRIEITKKLIKEKNFDAVIIEGDWPDAFRVNQYINGNSLDSSAESALLGFQRFPTWMWRNSEVLNFIDWLKQSNHENQYKKIQFLGMDLYSLFTSIGEVQKYLQKIDPDLSRKVAHYYSCFDHFNKDSQLYGVFSSNDEQRYSCEKPVLENLYKLIINKNYILALDKSENKIDYFSILQNARLIKNAENYYRKMFFGNVSTWNLRDEHMQETLIQIDNYLSSLYGRPSKLIVWAHNSHIGDASATQQGKSGEINLGHLMRKKYLSETYLLGFMTYQGFVIAADQWGGPTKIKVVQQALENSYENWFHKLSIKNFLMLIKEQEKIETKLPTHLLQRAIGVIYLPETERQNHYFYANLVNQYDALIYFDKTRAVKPLEKIDPYPDHEMPETYPTGF